MVGPNPVTIIAAGTTINGAASLVLSTLNGAASLFYQASQAAWFTVVDGAGGGGGEVNTASNVNAGGVGVFDAKVGVDLEFRGVNAGSSKISVALDAPNNEIDVDVNEGNIIHQNLSGAGVNTHAQIDTHIADTANPHATDVGNLGAGTLAELNTAIAPTTLDDSSDSRPPSGAAGGSLAGTYPNPTVDDGADGSAIHDDIAGEIAAIASKVPTGADFLLIEDAADSNSKKSIIISDLPGGGGGAVWTVATETTAARTAATGEFILVNVATCVITLPAPAADARVAVKVIIGAVTDIQIKTSGAGIDIDGTDYSSTGLALTAQYEQINLISDGTDWWLY
jgi:hypothetical protein